MFGLGSFFKKMVPVIVIILAFSNVSISAATQNTVTAPKAAVKLSPGGGAYKADQSITFSVPKGYTAYYTLDGSNPTSKKQKYSKPFKISKTSTVKYIYVDPKGKVSGIYTEKYTVQKASIPSKNAASDYKAIFLNEVIFDKNYCTWNSLDGYMLVLCKPDKDNSNYTVYLSYSDKEKSFIIFEGEITGYKENSTAAFRYTLKVGPKGSYTNGELKCSKGSAKITFFQDSASATSIMEFSNMDRYMGDSEIDGQTKANGNEVISIPDPNFEAVIRESIKKSSGNITRSDMLKVRIIDGYNHGITSIDGIQYAENASSLWLGNNKINDISKLSKLYKVSGLDLSDNSLSDINPISNLTRLTYIRASNNKISDITPLRNLVNLREIQLLNNNICDVSALANLPKLSIISLAQNNISDISSMRNLTQVKELILSDNKIRDVSPLKATVKLNYLHLGHNQISDISSLSNMTELTGFVASYNSISDIGALSNSKKLNMLLLDNNQVSDLTPISGLTGLKILSAQNNKVSDITALSGLVNLNSLDLSSNKITDISALAKLTNLTQYLKLDVNQISNIDIVSNFTKLDCLSVPGNKITNIDCLQNLTQLTELNLAGNKITSMEPLRNLTKLKWLYLLGNQTTDYSPVKGIFSQLEIHDLNM